MVANSEAFRIVYQHATITVTFQRYLTFVSIIKL